MSNPQRSEFMTRDPKNPPKAIPDGPVARGAESAEEGRDAIPPQAFYSPDDPIARPEGEIPSEAMFSPDEPLRREEDEEGVVTRLNGNFTHPPEIAPSLVWKLRHTADLMENLAQELREQGLGALKVNPDSGPVDTMIRSFLAGYLVGQMEEGD